MHFNWVNVLLLMHFNCTFLGTIFLIKYIKWQDEIVFVTSVSTSYKTDE